MKDNEIGEIKGNSSLKRINSSVDILDRKRLRWKRKEMGLSCWKEKSEVRFVWLIAVGWWLSWLGGWMILVGCGGFGWRGRRRLLSWWRGAEIWSRAWRVLAVVAGGQHEVLTLFRRCGVPEKIRIVRSAGSNSWDLACWLVVEGG
jgi:hypothetical protein